jgi:AraC-like DNA-binding protein
VRALDTLAASVGVSSSRLRHQFKALMGVSLGRFILIRRLQAAARLLRATDERIAHVATKVGLDRDLPRFRRAFRRHFNLSPSAYRAAGRPGRDTGSR